MVAVVNQQLQGHGVQTYDLKVFILRLSGKMMTMIAILTMMLVVVNVANWDTTTVFVKATGGLSKLA